MIKRRIYTLILLSFLCILYKDVKAQSYCIKSIDGNNVKIKLTNISHRMLSVSYLRDTLFIDEYVDTKDVRLLNDKFLQITYDTRGGSGLDLRNTVIISVNRSKINVATLVTSYAGLVSDDKDGLYWLKFDMKGDNSSNYELTVNVHDKQTSKLHPETNYKKNEVMALRFDRDLNIFYSTRKSIDKLFTINDNKSGQSGKQQINEILPVIVLGRNSYYYIKGEWYASGYGDNLFKDYYRKL